MTSNDKTVDERIAERRAREDALHQQLAVLQLDGPHRFPSGGFDPLSAMFGGHRDQYAICLRCGAVVMLADPEERPDGPPIERGVRLHTGWHEGLEADRG